MILIRVLIPLAIILILVWVAWRQFKPNPKDKKNEYTPSFNEEDIDEYISRIKKEIQLAKERAAKGIESAKEELSRYEKQLSKIEQLKNKKVDEF